MDGPLFTDGGSRLPCYSSFASGTHLLYEESQLQKQGMCAVGKSRGRKHHSPRLLQDQAGKASALSLPELRQDLLREHGDALPSAPVARWLERAGECCGRFNDQEMTGLHVEELQADEIRTIVGGKQQPLWVFAAIDVWSRLWPTTVVGRRSYRNTLALFRDVAKRMNPACFPLIATDGFGFYERVVRHVFGSACLYGQVIKTRRKDHVVRVERRELLGAAWRWEQALRDSEDSTQLNTSFIERLNLTIRQGSAYLCRRTLCYARRRERLEAHLELLRCHYNFIRPHRALKFGREIRTPAMQAGLTKRRLTFREIFSSTMVLLAWKKLTCASVRSVSSVIYDEMRMPLAA